MIDCRAHGLNNPELILEGTLRMPTAVESGSSVGPEHPGKCSRC